MTEEQIKENIFKGYNSIPLDIETIQCNQAEYISNTKTYTFKEFYFQFPYYLDEIDLYELGKSFKLLKIAYTYNPEKVFNDVGFKDRQLNLFDYMVLQNYYDNLRRTVPNTACKYILQRIPFEISREVMKLGFFCLYERYEVVLEEK